MSKLNPLHWSRKWQIIGGVGATVVLVAVIVGAVEGTKSSDSSSYPDYTPLNYTISERMNGTTFFDHFDYFTGADPSSGSVVYLSEEQATYSNLTYAGQSSAILRVDSTSTGTTDRNSVRITSKINGILDCLSSMSFIRHMAVALGLQSGSAILRIGLIMERLMLSRLLSRVTKGTR
jgi:hypothetical protein